MSPADRVRRRKAQEITLIYAVMRVCGSWWSQFVFFMGGHHDVLFPATLASLSGRERRGPVR